MESKYLEYSRSNSVFITGVGRSGTTVAFQILSSCTGTVPVFEPSSLRILVGEALDSNHQSYYRELISSLIFEEFLCGGINGRFLNFNSNEESFVGGFRDTSVIEEFSTSVGRSEIWSRRGSELPRVVCKIPNVGSFVSLASEIFWLVVVLVRSLDVVVRSMLRKDWYVDCGRDFQVDFPKKLMNKTGVERAFLGAGCIYR